MQDVWNNAADLATVIILLFRTDKILLCYYSNVVDSKSLFSYFCMSEIRMYITKTVKQVNAMMLQLSFFLYMCLKAYRMGSVTWKKILAITLEQYLRETQRMILSRQKFCKLQVKKEFSSVRF